MTKTTIKQTKESSDTCPRCGSIFLTRFYSTGSNKETYNCLNCKNKWDTKRQELRMNNKICSCGMPQSHPIPHEHDQTEREKQIITYYKELNKDMYKALKDIRDGVVNNPKRVGYGRFEKLIKALNKAEGK